MSTFYGLQHKGTGRWLASHPDMGALVTSADEADAVAWPTASDAILYALAEGFEGSWDWKEVTRETMHDYLAGQSKGDGHREA